MSINTNLPDAYSTRSSTTLSASPRDEGSDSSLSLKSKSTLETLREHPTSGSHTPYSSQTPDRTRRMSNTLSTLVDTSEPSPDHYHDLAGHPQDHSKLKAAWEAMLSRRFFSTATPFGSSILPFVLLYGRSNTSDAFHRPPSQFPIIRTWHKRTKKWPPLELD